MIVLSPDPRAGVKTTETGLRNIHRKGGPDGRIFVSVQLCDTIDHSSKRFRYTIPEGVSMNRAVMVRDTVLKAVEDGIVPNWDSLELLRKMITARLYMLISEDMKSALTK